MPRSVTATGSSATAWNRAASSAGNAAPDRTANRSIWRTFVTGMIPGRIGMVTPCSVARCTIVK